jgi:predicted transcriptional regulator
VFLLHAATALEHLAKAVLAARHPSLIVATNDFESLLHACGESGFARRPRAKMRTIGAGEAVARAGRFVPRLEALVPDLQLLILVRNGVAHLGEAATNDADEVLVPYLKASEELRGALDEDRASYWGEFLDLVDSALKENVEKARLRIQTALALARQEFEKRFGALDSTTREAMLRVIEFGYTPDKYDEQLLECPACNTPALVSVQ